ncbi:heparan-alpha-glucosaminide N-acetyltransferase domain-containing protein [Kocuria sp. CPCC 205292]|uniref:heparan-alpha-glucosaminide N-acetyltransferase domain-containing protein n=1 Tax=Kocuria cellulosilytica TaxID=3071451 RepID=UPI0034D6B599
MNDHPTRDRAAEATGGLDPRRSAGRLVAVDAARGLALVGLTAVHFLPQSYPDNDRPTLSWLLFAGDSAALFALLAGVSLAFSTGGRRPRRGRDLTAARAGIAVRALLIMALGLTVDYLMPADPPAVNILVHYGLFFLLALPFLGLRPRTLLLCAGGFLLVGPFLIHWLGDLVPEHSSVNPTFAHLVTEPAALFWQLTLTGTYPAVTYLSYLLAGLAFGRLNLKGLRVQARLLAVGLGLAALAKLVSWVLLYGMDGYNVLLYSIVELTRADLDHIIVFGGDGPLPTSSLWWQVLSAPHANTPLSVAWSLGVSTAVLGALLLAGREFGKWLLPLTAMGTMTLTLYTGQLVLLSTEVHYSSPLLWSVACLVVSALVALAWRHAFGRGPLERVVSAAAHATARAVADRGTSRGPDLPRKPLG